MTQRVTTPTWSASPDVKGIAIEGGFDGLANNILRVNAGQNGMELSSSVSVNDISASTLAIGGDETALSVNGAGAVFNVPASFSNASFSYETESGLQRITQQPSDAAVAELQSILIAYKLALDQR